MTTDPKQAKKMAADFALHVQLLMQTRGLTKSKAQFTAWAEGPKGLEALLAPLFHQKEV